MFEITRGRPWTKEELEKLPGVRVVLAFSPVEIDKSSGANDRPLDADEIARVVALREPA